MGVQGRRRVGDRVDGRGLADVGELGLEVVGEAVQRIDGLADPEHEDEGRVRGQLHVHVRALAQLVGDLVAGAAGLADVDDDPQRVPRGDSRRPDQLLPDHPAARNRLDALAGAGGGVQRAVQEVLPVDRELAPRRVQRRVQERRGARGADQPQRAGDAAGVHAAAVGHVKHRRLGERADDLVGRGQDRVGALVQGGRGHARMEAEVRAPRLVDDQRGVVGVRHPGEPRDVGGHPVVGRRDHEGRTGVRGGGERGVEVVGHDAVGHPELGLVGRRDPARPAARQDEAVDDRAVGVALGDHRGAERRQREHERVVALGGAVGEEPGPPGAVEVGGEDLGLVERRRERRRDVDAAGVLGDVHQQRVVADVVAQRRVGAGPALVPGDAEAGRLAEAVGRERVEVGRGALLEVGVHDAADSSR